MKSTELAEEVKKIVVEAQNRITGVGAEQYARNDMQKFETMTMRELLIYMEEELLDQINYAVMNLLRVRWLGEAIKVIGHEAVSPGNAQYLGKNRQAVAQAMHGKPIPQAAEPR